jgi:hypothetical protein
VGAGGAHRIARFPFTKTQVSQTSNRLRHRIDLAPAWSPAIRGTVGVPKAEPARDTSQHEQITTVMRVAEWPTHVGFVAALTIAADVGCFLFNRSTVRRPRLRVDPLIRWASLSIDAITSVFSPSHEHAITSTRWRRLH